MKKVKQTDIVHFPGDPPRQRNLRRPGLLEFYATKAEDDALKEVSQYALLLEAKLDALMEAR